jgi:hypothetical protein
MRRYDERRTLAQGAAGEAEIRAVGRRLAAFHAAAAHPADAEGSIAALDRMLTENLRTLRELEADPATVDDAERLAESVLAGRRGRGMEGRPPPRRPGGVGERRRARATAGRARRVTATARRVALSEPPRVL